MSNLDDFKYKVIILILLQRSATKVFILQMTSCDISQMAPVSYGNKSNP